MSARPTRTCGLNSVIVMLFALFTVASLAAAEPAAFAAGNEDARWSSFLPFMADQAIKLGHELPLPFGLSAVYYYIERDIEVTDLRIGLNGAPPRSVSRFVDLGSDSHVNVALARIDAWVLPFVNVYGLLGYVHNESTTRGTVTVPAPGPLPGSRTFEFTATTTLDGLVGGGGLTLAAGYREFFVTADANYTQTDIGFDDTFRALVASMRTGWNGTIAELPTRLWLGVMYWDTKNTASASVNVPGEGAVRFEADQGPANPWNASVGGSIALSRHWELFAEYGFNFDDVRLIAAGLAFRF